MRYVTLIVALTIVLAGVPSNVVSEKSEAPIVDAGLDQSVEAGETVYLDGGGSFDPDGQIASYSWTVETPDGSTLATTDPNAERTTFTAAQEGRYYATLTVTDGDGVSNSDTLYVDSDIEDGDGPPSQVNELPTGGIEGPNTVVQGRSATFSVNARDPDGRIESYGWSTGGEGRNVQRTFTESVGSRVTISVLLTDEDGATNRVTKSVTVVGDSADSGDSSANNQPTVDIEGPSRMAVGESRTFLLSARDSDGTVVSRSWIAPEAGDGSTLTHSFDTNGTYTVTARVTDDDGASVTATHRVEVYGSGEPVASISGPETAPSGSFQTYSLEAYDPDGGRLTISWNPAQNQLERSASRFENVVSIDSPSGSTVTVSATVTDDEGNSVTVVKNTDVTGVTGRSELRVGPPQISDLEASYILDESIQQSSSDTIEAGTYAFSATIDTVEREPVRVRWEFNDSTTITDSLGRFNGTRTSSIEHQFVSENGSAITIGLWVEAMDASGNSTRRKWVSRVRSVAGHTNARLAASNDGQTVSSGGRLTVPAGSSVNFDAYSLQHFRIEFGDGVTAQFSGSDRFQSFSHEYENTGVYSVQLTSIQGPGGYATKRVKINVTRHSYSEYWYGVRSSQLERTISSTRPSGDDWSRVRINHVERYFTGNTVTYDGTAGRNLDLGEEWVITDTSTVQRPRTIFRTYDSDPDGAGSEWTLSESYVGQETRTYYEDQYRWFENRYGTNDWSRTGETRTQRIAVDDGHDHDRTRHTDRERSSCSDWRLEPSLYGGFDRSCESWNYDTDVWYSGHDHDGYVDYDTDYRYHREIERTEQVWLHEYSRTTMRTIPVTEYSETASRNYWLWERTFGSEYQTEHSLTEPSGNSFVEGTLRRVEVECGSERSHFGAVMC